MLGQNYRKLARSEYLRPRWRRFERLESRRCLDVESLWWLGDLNTAPVTPFPTQFLPAQDFVYFTASDPDHGNELWRTDGTVEGTMLIKDVLPGAGSSYIQLGTYGRSGGNTFAIQNNVLYFVANDGVHGSELWRSDGTLAGTHLVRDLCECGSYPSSLQFVGNTLYFSAYVDQVGRELWKTDGTESGTVLVKDIHVNGGSYVGAVHELRGQLLFSAIDEEHGREWWSSDGTAAGTQMVIDLNPSGDGVPQFCGHRRCTISSITHQDRVYFFGNDGATGESLWVTDGTSAGTIPLTPANSVYSFFGGFLTPSGSQIFFTGRDADHGGELWVSDGTRTGTRMVRDIERGPASSYPSSPFAAGQFFYFSASQNPSGRELWRTDGTAVGTTLIEMNSTGSSYSFGMAHVGETLFFSASTSSQGSELWLTNRQETRVVRKGGDTLSPLWARAVNQRLIYADTNASGQFSVWGTDEKAQDLILLQQGTGAYNAVTSWKDFVIYADGEGRLWRTDGTQDGTRELVIATQTQDSSPISFTSFRGQTYFFAYQRDLGWGFFVHSPVDDQKQLVTRIASAQPTSLQVLRDRLVFLSGGELWTSDGTAAGTARVTSKVTGITEIRVAGDRLFLLTNDDLWSSDGTDKGTLAVRSNLDSHVDASSVPTSLTAVGSRVFFSANTNSSGRELWTSDGTLTGTVMLRNIHGSGSSYPSSFLPVGDLLYFAADDGVSGREVWRTDGTRDGTKLVLDVRPGNLSSDPQDMKAVGSFLLFQADDGVHGRELWITDGSASGTRLLVDFNEREFANGSSPSPFVIIGSKIYFSAQDENGRWTLWMMPADRSGPPQPVLSQLSYIATVLPLDERVLVLADRGDGRGTNFWALDGANIIDISSGQFSQLDNVTQVGNTIYFTALSPNMREIWKTDGTRSGTVQVSDFNTGSANPNQLVAVGNTLYFVAERNDSSGREIFKTDGTRRGTVLVRDINSGQASSYPADFRVVGDLLFFSAEDPEQGRELWVTDGTTSGTRNFDLWTRTRDAAPEEFVELGGWTYFVATYSNNVNEIWKTDGTASGTSRVTEFRGPGRIERLHVSGNRLYFVASDTMFESDGTLSGTRPIVDVRGASLTAPRDITTFGDQVCLVASTSAGGARSLFCMDSKNSRAVTPLLELSASALPTELTVAGDMLFFVMDDGQHGRELWRTDGSRQGTHLVEDIFSSVSTALAPQQFVLVGEQIFFTATDNIHGEELWVTNGTAAGTRLVVDLIPGAVGSKPSELTEFNGKLAFSAIGDGNIGRELWTSDGSSQGTLLVRDIDRSRYATLSSNPSSLIQLNGLLYFFATTSATGTELWRSDGTSSGTRNVRNTAQGESSSIRLPDQLVSMGNSLYFVADDGVHGRELWKSDGTSRTTVMVKDLAEGAVGSIDTDPASHKLVVQGSRLYFAANSDGQRGAELWVSDGTEVGTVMLYDPPTLEPGARTLPLDAEGDWLYFSAYAPEQGVELWRTNGTVEGTSLVADMSPGLNSTTFFPHGEFSTLPDGRMLFPAITTTTGRELWVTNGTAAGTFSLDLELGPGSVQFGNLVQVPVIDRWAYFYAATASRGSGLWRTDGTRKGTERLYPGFLDPWPDLTKIGDRLYFGVTHGNGNLAQVQGDGDITYFPLLSNDTTAASDPTQLTSAGKLVYFTADDDTHGRELWISDGTTEGTRMVVDAVLGPSDSEITAMMTVGSQLFFSRTDAVTGSELWVTQGTPETTRLVRELVPGSQGSFPRPLTVWRNQLVFLARRSSLSQELWISDGTELGTRPLGDVAIGETGAGASSPSAVVYQDRLILWTGNAPGTRGTLYRFDSPDAAPIAISDPHVTGAPRMIGDRIYYRAWSLEYGDEPWVSDGSREGARMVVDVNTSSSGANPLPLAVYEEWLYFSADRDGFGQQWYRANGKPDDIQMITSVFVGLTPGRPLEIRSSTKGLYLTQIGASGRELWRLRTAPKPAAELVWREPDGGIGQFQWMDVVDDRLFFMAFDPLVGAEVWVTDGTPLGTRLVRDLQPGPQSSGVQAWRPMRNPLGTPVSDGLVIVTNNSGTGDDLWFTDGTEAGTYPIADVGPSSTSVTVSNLTVLGNQILFSGNDGLHGWEPWISDGTREGTRMVANLDTRTESSSLSWLTVTGTDLYFVRDQQGDRRLWRWRSKGGELHPVSDAPASPSSLANVDGTLYFSADAPEKGHELWLTDGTAKGTRLVADVSPGPRSSYPSSITGTSTGLYFSAVDATHGREAWWLSPLVGDTNADREVNFIDFLALAYHYGNVGTRQEGDFDNDGRIEFVDLLLLAENYGRSSFAPKSGGL